MKAHKHFYNHIVETSSITLSIADMDIPKEDRIELIRLAEENLHHSILDMVLEHLSEEEKIEFFNHIQGNDHKKTIKYLKDRVDDIEDQILKVGLKIKKDLHSEIEESKKKKG